MERWSRRSAVASPLPWRLASYRSFIYSKPPYWSAQKWPTSGMVKEIGNKEKSFVP
jgi:hypothetical protein